MTNTMKNIFLDNNEQELFKNLALRYVEIAAKEGIKVVPFESPEMPLFEAATPELRKKATDSLKTIVDTLEETIAHGENAINSKRLIWRALGKLSLVPGPDIFEQFGDDDVVIIYQENQTIIFWNLQFFKYASFTVEQLFFTAWYNFTKRDPAIHEKLYAMALNIISGKITKTFKPDVPGHEVQEIDTLGCNKTWMELPVGSVLTRDGVLGGILIVQKMRLIG